ncbi:MAG: ABC transporter permease [Thermoflexales bacterium]|nr:ABC transporter permease [Thermoflexales bacterium]MDW8351427.1 ABC transporter permease [Anaerolineae bacterium]
MIGQFILRRLLGLLAVLAAISIATFVLARVVPKDPARLIAGPRANAQAVEALRERLGLNGSIPEQYVRYMAALLRGDLGMSFSTKRPVLQDIQTFLPATAELTIAALLISLSVGIPAGILSAAWKDSPLDYIGRFASTLGVSLPPFWVALVGQLVGYYLLSVLPVGGRLSQGIAPPPTVTGLYTLDSLLAGQWATFADALWHLILPAFVLSFGVIAVFLRMMRASMLEVLQQDYIRAARAKGLTQRAVVLRHAVRNALIPTLTILGLQVGLMMSGSFLIESILQWPGLGLYAANALLAADYNATMGVTLVLATIYTVANVIVDIAYGLADPRLRVT